MVFFLFFSQTLTNKNNNIKINNKICEFLVRTCALNATENHKNAYLPLDKLRRAVELKLLFL